MAKYCDSAKLEYNWFCWIMGSQTPELEPFRELRILWSKPVEYVRTATAQHPSPTSKIWLHCIATGYPFYFASELGTLCHHPREPINDHGIIPQADWITLISDHPCLALDNPFYVPYLLIPHLKSEGYILEQPTTLSWDNMHTDIFKTCTGVARKFNITEEDRSDLVQETMTQIIRKLRKGKLIYSPGKAPVFNLITTTIHRCMFSILNKSNRIKNSTTRLVADVKAGVTPQSLRSFRIPV